VPIVCYMDFSAIALQGLEQAQAQMVNAVSGLAGAAASGLPLDTVALSEEAVALSSAKTNYSANLTVLPTADQMDKQATDLMA